MFIDCVPDFLKTLRLDAAFRTRKDRMGVVNSVKSFLYFWYLQYTLNTSIYMLEPLEQFLFNVFLVGFLSISAYTFYVFVPAHVVQIYELIFGLRQVPAAT